MNDPAPPPPEGYKLIIDRDRTVRALVKGDAVFDHRFPHHGWSISTEDGRIPPDNPISVAVLQEKVSGPPTVPDGYEPLQIISDHQITPKGAKAWSSGNLAWFDVIAGQAIDTRYHYIVPKSYSTPPTPHGESVLQEAERLVNGDRQQSYGEATESFKRIAKLWTAYRGAEFTPKDVASMMILMKVSRSVTSNKRDNWVDIAGYAELGSKLEE